MGANVVRSRAVVLAAALLAGCAGVLSLLVSASPEEPVTTSATPLPPLGPRVATPSAMDIFDVMRRRRSIRAYRPDEVDAGTLARVLACANGAPSAGNLQAYEIVVVTAAATRARLAEGALGQEHVAGAPVVLVFLADPARSASKYGPRGAGLYALQDATIACAHAQLAAAALGLGSCWVGAFDEEAVRRVVRAPATVRPVALLTVGYAAEEPPPSSRRSLDDLVGWESFFGGGPPDLPHAPGERR